MLTIKDYKRIIIESSAGKDSTAAFLHLLESGASIDQIEIHHQEIDGRENASHLMDWAFTCSWVRALAKHFDVPCLNQWRVGGFERELLKNDQPSAPVKFETLDGKIRTVYGEDRKNTRLRFPQQSNSHSLRWCTSKLKLEVEATAICSQTRFYDGKTLIVTGERWDESPARKKLQFLEPHRTDCRNSRKLPRYVDHYRPVLDWSERQIWEILQRWRINMPPSYYLGFGRQSCACCIFGSAAQWATLYLIDPERVHRIAELEKRFDCTINRPVKGIRRTVLDLAMMGIPYPNLDPHYLEAARSEFFLEPIIVPAGKEWILPAGAYGDQTGPT